jgi:D-arginine dehydrogenase
MPSSDVDIVIIGAGLAGAATAFHLKLTSQLRTVILEQEDVPGAHSSGRNAAVLREQADLAELQPLLSRGAAELRSGRLARFERNGVVLLGHGDEAAERHFPRAAGRGRWCPDDGIVDVAALLQAYLAGQDVRCGVRVRGWTRRGDGLSVDTTAGAITCRMLVNAGGPWAGALGRLPLTPMNRHVFVTAPLDWVPAQAPTVWDGAGGLYFRPESGGLLLSPCDETPARPGDYAENPAMLDELAEKVAAQQPALGALSISHSWVGQRVFAPDRRFVIGFDPRDDRLFHIAGLGGHGVTASWAIGKLAADMLSGRAPGVPALAPERLDLPAH